MSFAKGGNLRLPESLSRQRGKTQRVGDELQMLSIELWHPLVA